MLVIIVKYQVLLANICVLSDLYTLSVLYKSENSIFFPSDIPTRVSLFVLLDC